jgi:hypothetical protein
MYAVSMRLPISCLLLLLLGLATVHGGKFIPVDRDQAALPLRAVLGRAEEAVAEEESEEGVELVENEEVEALDVKDSPVEGGRKRVRTRKRGKKKGNKKATKKELKKFRKWRKRKRRRKRLKKRITKIISNRLEIRLRDIGIKLNDKNIGRIFDDPKL